MFKSRWAFALLFMALSFVIVQCSEASLPSEVDEASVGGFVGQIPGTPLSSNANIAIPYTAGAINGFVAALAQSNGSKVRSQYYAEAGIGISDTDARFVGYIAGTGRGDSFSDMGTNNDAGVNFEFLVKDITIKGGLFGRSGGPWGGSNAVGVLVANGFDEDKANEFTNPAGVGLAEFGPEPTGLSFFNRRSVNLRAGWEFELADEVGGDVAFVSELFGSGDEMSEAVDQAIATLNGSIELGEKFNFQWGIQLGAQRIRGGGDIESQVAGHASFNYLF